MSKFLIGIDTGTTTGFAIACDSGRGGKLQEIKSLSITKAMARTIELVNEHGKDNIKIFIEDPRKRTWFGDADARQRRSGPGVREGIGSVKRDASIWEDWCKEQGLNYLMVHPAANKTKMDKTEFARYTGWTKTTSEHGRDVAMLVHQRFAKF